MKLYDEIEFNTVFNTWRNCELHMCCSADVQYIKHAVRSVSSFSFPTFFTDLFSFSRRARVRWSCSLSWCSRWASSMCCPHGESWSRAGLEWRRRYWSSSLSPPHRRQHTEPPAHSHQQHKAEQQRRAATSRQKHGRASRTRTGITGQDTVGQNTMTTALHCARLTVKLKYSALNLT